MVLAAGVIATLFVDVSWGVCLYISLYFIFPANRWWYTIPTFRYTFLVGIILFICYLLKKQKYKGQPITHFPQFKWLVFMVVLMAVISFYAVWPERHNRFLILQLKQLVFLFLAYKVIDSNKKLMTVIWTYLAGNLYVAYLIVSVGRNSLGRVEGMGMPDGKDSNMTSAVLITAVPILLCFLIKKKGWYRPLILIMLAVIINAIVLLNSRGAFLGLTVAFLYFICSLFFTGGTQRSLKERFMVIVLFVGCCGMFVYLTDNIFWQRMQTLIEVSSGSTHGGTRTLFWLKSYELVQEHPFGLGVDGFEYLSPTILPEEWMSTDTGTRAIHSTYFQALSDLGYLGLLILSGFIFSTIKMMWRVKKKIKLAGDLSMYYLGTALQSSFFAFLIASLFINRFYAEVLYWLMLFMACFNNLSTRSLAELDTKLTKTVEERD